jgi:hypothetical protein
MRIHAEGGIGKAIASTMHGFPLVFMQPKRAMCSHA